jgi:hypothetical protein
LSDKVQSVFGFFHALSVSLTDAITTEPSLGGPICFIGPPIIRAGIELSLQVNGTHNLVVLSSLVIIQFGAAADKQNDENSQNVASADYFVISGKSGGTPDNHLSNVTRFW